jgi:hypothetical protein
MDTPLRAIRKVAKLWDMQILQKAFYSRRRANGKDNNALINRLLSHVT